MWKRAACRKQFSVTVGTFFERSKIPLSKWLFAAYLLCSSKKGMSAHQLHRTLGVTYKTVWFLAHRIRHAMDTTGGLLGQNGGIIEADETYIGRKPGVKKGRGGFRHKNTVSPWSNATAKSAPLSSSISRKSKEPSKYTHRPMLT
jgi:hypothetical protein